jgi:hypothetical protein
LGGKVKDNLGLKPGDFVLQAARIPQVGPGVAGQTRPKTELVIEKFVRLRIQRIPADVGPQGQ